MLYTLGVRRENIECIVPGITRITNPGIYPELKKNWNVLSNFYPEFTRNSIPHITFYSLSFSFLSYSVNNFFLYIYKIRVITYILPDYSFHRINSYSMEFHEIPHLQAYLEFIFFNKRLYNWNITIQNFSHYISF